MAGKGWFGGIREVAWPVIAIFFAGHLALNIFTNYVLFDSGLLAPLYDATGGLINGTLQANLFLLAVLVGGIIFGLGRLRPRDVGLIWRDLPAGLALSLLLWALVQAVVLVIALAGGGGMELHPRWASSGAAVIGALLGQLLGNALFEEIGYRGFLLPQLGRKLGTRFSRRATLILALLISQALFALMHLPGRMSNGMSLAEALASLPMTMVFGVCFCFFYLRTGSVFWAIGFHAVANTPTLIFAYGGDASVLVWLVAIAMLLLSLSLWGRFPAAARRHPTLTAS